MKRGVLKLLKVSKDLVSLMWFFISLMLGSLQVLLPSRISSKPSLGSLISWYFGNPHFLINFPSFFLGSCGRHKHGMLLKIPDRSFLAYPIAQLLYYSILPLIFPPFWQDMYVWMSVPILMIREYCQFHIWLLIRTWKWEWYIAKFQLGRSCVLS